MDDYTMYSSVSRLHVVDALRGFAIVSIILLHNIEHYDLYYIPSDLPEWMIGLDKSIMRSAFFLFSGKAYSIFSLLFGLTFFIQYSNQEKKGKDFRGRFAWRLFLLFIIGIINSAFYEGDILTFYAIIGFVLIPSARLSNKVILWIAFIFLIQPYELVNLFKALQNPDMEIVTGVWGEYYRKNFEYVTGSSLIKEWISNLTNGKMMAILWMWENGRIMQIPAFFILGMLAGRKSLFDISSDNKKIWVKTLSISSVLFIILLFVKSSLGYWIDSRAIRHPLYVIESSWTDMAFTSVQVSGFVLLYQTRFYHRILHYFSSIGRMSLSNYLLMTIIGVTLYHGFGLGMYKFTGGTYCLVIGIALATFQLFFSLWWSKKYIRGPFEAVWHKATWLGSNKLSI